MTWKDKLEIGLKDDAPFRRDNLPDFQKVEGGLETQPGDPARSPEEPGARQDAEEDAVTGSVTPRSTSRRFHAADPAARGPAPE